MHLTGSFPHHRRHRSPELVAPFLQEFEKIALMTHSPLSWKNRCLPGLRLRVRNLLPRTLPIPFCLLGIYLAHALQQVVLPLVASVGSARASSLLSGACRTGR